MNNRYVLIALAAILMSRFATPFEATRAEFEGQILISADGSVQPPEAPLVTFDNLTYFLTGNVSGSIVNHRNNTTIDGLELNLQGSGIDTGVNLASVRNVTIKNLHISNFQYGIHVFSSENCAVLNNRISGNIRFALFLDNSSGNSLEENTITENGVGVVLWQNSCKNRVSGNTIVANREYGVHVYKSSNDNRIQNNNITINSWDAIRVFDSSNNSIFDNHLIGNLAGVTLDYSFRNTVAQNTISNNSANGVGLANSFGNHMTENSINSNFRGFIFTNSSNNTLVGNHVFEHQLYGISLVLSNGNSVVHNSFRNNFKHAYTSISQGNLWDRGYPTGGNFWSDYEGTDADLDGIGDIPYRITSLDGDDISDNNPLMGTPYSYRQSPGDQELIEIISNSTISAFQVTKENSTIAIRFNVSSQAESGFCRMCLPRSIILPPYLIIIDNGQIPLLYFNETTFQNDTHNWMYFAYPHTEHEIVVVSEMEELAALATLLLSLVGIAIVLGSEREQVLQRISH